MEVTTVGGIPVECLSGELAGIWSGWKNLGEREIVREASAKGTHISLAYKCLACRRQCSIKEAQEYFSKEVDIWVNELLSKQQVHKASHILRNMGKNSIDYINKFCIMCQEPKLRDYLAEYLVNMKGFQDVQKEAWDILKVIGVYKEKFHLQNVSIYKKSIQEIINIPEDIKNALCTELCFNVFDLTISKKLLGPEVWNYLLLSNRINMLQFWIDVNYLQSITDKKLQEYSNEECELFKNLKITDEMIESVESSRASYVGRQQILNYLTRYGVFNKKERISMKLILARFFNSGVTPSEFEEILSCASCNLDKSTFSRRLNISLYSKQYLEENKMSEIDMKNEKLSNALMQMCTANDSYVDALEKGILETVSYISDDYDKFFKQNYIIALTLVWLQYKKKSLIVQNTEGLTEEEILKDIFLDENGLDLNNFSLSHDILQNILTNVPILKRSMMNDSSVKSITMYKLLNGYKNLNALQLFEWRQQKQAMPNFASAYLVKKYGHKERLTYISYIKQCRPNVAAIILQQHQEKSQGKLTSKMKSQAAFDAHIFGLRNLSKPEIACSCVSFIEILGMDSESLRLHITVANYIRSALNISIESLLEAVLYQSEKALKSVLSYFEKSLVSRLTILLINDSAQFVCALRKWEILVRFAQIHGATLPDGLLKFLANHNFWFEFLLVGQIFAYPVDQMMKTTRYFQDSNVRDHLMAALGNPRLLKTELIVHENQKFKSRDPRQLLFPKIGLNQPNSQDSPSSSSATFPDLNKFTGFNSTESTLLNCSTYAFTNDLWFIILKCHQSQDPPGALVVESRLNSLPILTVLAACYEPFSAISYWYSWLVISVKNKEIESEYEQCMEHQMWSADKVFHLFQIMVSHGYVDTLNRSFQIFMPENPLRPFFEFLTQCIKFGNFRESEKSLLDFKSGCSTLKCNKIIDWECTDMTYLKNVSWIASVAVNCIVVALAQSFCSSYMQIKFLEVLVKLNFNADLPVDAPEFSKLLEYIRILFKTGITLNFLNYGDTKAQYNYESEVEKCVNDLIMEENYTSALQLSTVAGKDVSRVILAQYRKALRDIDKSACGIPGFWERCATDFKKYNVCFEQAAEFFVEYAEKVLSHKERYKILRLALDNLRGNSADQKTIDTVEMAMWKSCVLAGPENIEVENEYGIFNKLKTELLCGLTDLQITCTLSNVAEETAVDTLISKWIDADKLDVALRIATFFNYKHMDLQILMLCLSLAEGEILPNELTLQQKALLTVSNKSKLQKFGTLRNRGLQRHHSTQSLNVLSTKSNHSESPEKGSATTAVHQVRLDCTLLLETLLENLQHGLNTGTRIILCYRLATYLGKSYQSLLTLENPTQFLQDIIKGHDEHKFEIAHDIIVAYHIENDDVAYLLAERIVAIITSSIEDESDEFIVLNSYPLDVTLNAFIELCSEPSLLGQELLKKVTKMLGRSCGEKRDISTLKIAVEILIKSHDCFTTSCNMEGIASILRKCQQVANSLKTLKHWSLLVRLVTGVGRFTEMHYVFQILKDHYQFEFLLGKGLDKVPGLKMALLEFVKRQCPNDKDLFNLVALHFRLYYEIAIMWENEAKKLLNELVTEARKEMGKTYSSQTDLKLTKTESILKRLNLLIANFTHAAEYYLQHRRVN
ncbi:spatacsin isoform X2 [Orussus abietinus]|uniref:spatacsin isoform X2 n=1 Tax=Orussus abietinus TaxID=222816 RepID=UPI000626EB34|nr:spatacsin isoform X2 [Orussus abietinus]